MAVRGPVAKKRPAPVASVAQSVRSYIDARPVVRDALGLGIVNLSALTRRIRDEAGLGSEEAVLVACRRYKAPQGQAGYQAAIRRVLDKSKLEVRTKVATLTARNSWKLTAKLEKAMATMQGLSSPVHVLQGSESVTIITDEALLKGMEETIGEDVIKVRRGLVELNIRSPDSIEDVAGILSFLATSLSARGINFNEVISCYKDNIFIVDEADLFPAFQVLNGLIKA